MSEQGILFSIIVCSCDKDAALLVSMKSLLTIQLEDAEIILVDNGTLGMSSGFVLTLEAGFSHRSIPFTYVRETNPGLSNARNAGARRADGTYLLYLDDDCVPISELLNEYARAIEVFPRTGIAGGTILPRWEDDSPPDWLPSEFTWVFGEIKYSSDTVRTLKRREKINGGNFLIRRDYLSKLGGFDPKLGNIGSSFGGAEEQDLLEMARSEKSTDLIYVPQAVVRHEFPMERLSPSYVANRLYKASYDRFRSDVKRGKWLIVAARSAWYAAKLLAPKPSLNRHQYKGYLDSLLKFIKMRSVG